MSRKKSLISCALVSLTGLGRHQCLRRRRGHPITVTANTAFLGGSLSGHAILFFGLAVCIAGAVFGIFQYRQTRALQVHKSMADVSHIIWETCKTYLFQQGKFLAALWILIAICMIYYFKAAGKSHRQRAW